MKLFGEETDGDWVTGTKLEGAKSNIGSFGFELPPKPCGHRFPKINFPKLQGSDIGEHFDNIARKQLGDIPDRADRFVKCKLPPLPKKLDLKLTPGWVRYGKDGSIRSVDHPEEDVFTFDTETFVKGGSYPVIGTAVSEEACYLWLAKEFLDPSLEEEEWDQYDMVPVGTEKLIIAHNASYDRVRTQEAYTMPDTPNRIENYWLDTLSMHIACCGLASGQRWLYILQNRDPELLTKEEKVKLRYKPKWLNKGATNSLVECYNFHVYESRKWMDPDNAHRMEQADKIIRDVFVKAERLEDFQPLLIELIYYALKDSWYTSELFQCLYPRYMDATPSPVALMGHFFLAASRVPFEEEWHDWLHNTEDVYQEHIAKMSGICRSLLDKEVAGWQEAFRKDWDAIDLPERKKKKFIKDSLKAKDTSFLKHVTLWKAKDPWRNQVDWNPRVIGNSRKFPEFKGEILPIWCSNMIMDTSMDIGVKTVAAHLLLKLKWEGSPIIKTDEEGWKFFNKESKSMEKVPHPKRPGENVGGLLSKDFVKLAEKGFLTSDLEEAQTALQIANSVSYWTSVRKRCFERYAVLCKTPGGERFRMMAPGIVPHGTTTRRVVEPLFATMCSTKHMRIGTELKTRITAPPGMDIVGADYDGQEMRIAAVYADVWESGFIGGSPLGYQVLSGSKDMGTDSHTKITREAFPEFFEDIVYDPELGMCEVVK